MEVTDLPVGSNGFAYALSPLAGERHRTIMIAGASDSGTDKLENRSGTVTDLAWSVDGKIASGSSDGTVMLRAL